MIYFVEDDNSIRELVLYTLNNAGYAHIFSLICVAFGYGYFAEVLVLCVADRRYREAISWTNRRKLVVPWH